MPPLKCESCGKSYTVRNASPGKRYRCPKCKQPLVPTVDPVKNVPPSAAPAAAEGQADGQQVKGRHPRRDKKKTRGLAWLSWTALLALLAGGGYALYHFAPAVGSPKKSGTADARRTLSRDGVALTITEPAGVAREGEPVTSGIPLPEGGVTDIGMLSLVSGEGQSIPCQFTPLCRWPDGSLKWVLLDFQTDIEAGGKVSYSLRTTGVSAAPKNPVKVVDTGLTVTVETGRLRYKVSKDEKCLVGSVEIDGKRVVTPKRPIQVVMVNGDGKTYRASKPTRLLVESKGPMRSTLLIQGEFVNDDGDRIFSGKVGYDLRVTAFAGKPKLKLDFTLKNSGFYGYRNERKPKQWLHFGSLRIDVPVSQSSAKASWSAVLPTGKHSLSDEPLTLTQWYKYPSQDARGYYDIRAEKDEPREDAAGLRHKPEGFYYWLTEGEQRLKHGERTLGWATLRQPGGLLTTAVLRRFWQNFPRGIEVARGRVSFLLWPDGGFWPRTEAAYKSCTYQLEGGRHKTAEMLLVFDGDGDSLAKRCEAPLFAKAPAAWYRASLAVWPLGPTGLRSEQNDLNAALERFDKMQLAKVHVDIGDPAGPLYGVGEDQWNRVSIPDLWERCPDIFYGWMNYGDLVWSFGYCSLYYDWPYSMLIQYLRFGDRAFLDLADDMTSHRYDIDQYHVAETASYLGLFQRYERGQHGNLGRQEVNKGRDKWEGNARPSHTWNRGLLLHWVLTGDPRSLQVARDNGKAFHNYFYGQMKLKEKEALVYKQFRSPAWAMDNWLALYEYTGEKKYLDWASEIFSKTLLTMEKNNGACGHIIKDGRQSAQFTGYMVEPVCRLHRLTGRKDAIAFLKRVLDWQRKKGTRRGQSRDGKYYPLLFVEKWDVVDSVGDSELHLCASSAYGFLLADGYAYLYSALGDKKDLAFARRVFRETVFYHSMDDGCAASARAPLGYHHGGSPFGAAAKIHAYSGRYHQLYLVTESGCKASGQEQEVDADLCAEVNRGGM